MACVPRVVIVLRVYAAFGWLSNLQTPPVFNCVVVQMVDLSMSRNLTIPTPHLACYIPDLQIKTFNKDNVSNTLMTKVKKYINNPDFSFENVAKVRKRHPNFTHRIPSSAKLGIVSQHHEALHRFPWLVVVCTLLIILCCTSALGPFTQHSGLNAATWTKCSIRRGQCRCHASA